MSAGIKANNDGSAAIQVNGTDRVTLSTAGVMSVPAGITAPLTGDVTGAATKLSTASGDAPSYSARAWVNFNGTGTVAIRASGNVSSITDNGVGNYTVNFTTAMPDANYAVIGTSGPGGYNGTQVIAQADDLSRGTNTTLATQIRVGVDGSGTGAGVYDSSFVYVAIFR